MLDKQSDCRTLLARIADRLGGFADLAPADVQAVLSLSGAQMSHARGSDLGAANDQAPRIVTQGWACQMLVGAQRRPQIFSFVLPGDVIGSFWRQPEFVFSTPVALTRVHTLDARAWLTRTSAGALRHEAVVTAARRAEDHAQHLLLNQIVRLGARDAYAGLAHLLMELHDRLAQIGLAQGGCFQLPVGQRVLAQAMGFSLAHTNHTMQRMTADGLFEMDGENIRLLNPVRLADIAGFAAPLAHSRTSKRSPMSSHQIS